MTDIHESPAQPESSFDGLMFYPAEHDPVFIEGRSPAAVHRNIEAISRAYRNLGPLCAELLGIWDENEGRPQARPTPESVEEAEHLHFKELLARSSVGTPEALSDRLNWAPGQVEAMIDHAYGRSASRTTPGSAGIGF